MYFLFFFSLQLRSLSDQASRLKNYRDPHQAGVLAGGPEAAAVSGDFSLVLFDVLRLYISVKEEDSKLTIADINQMLDQLSHDRDKSEKSNRQIH